MKVVGQRKIKLKGIAIIPVGSKVLRYYVQSFHTVDTGSHVKALVVPLEDNDDILGLHPYPRNVLIPIGMFFLEECEPEGIWVEEPEKE